jgi:hypothetical protein
MPRRASSSTSPVWILAAAFLLIASVAGGYFLYNNVSDPYRTLTALDVRSYLENSNSLRGNTYKISGTIANSLSWSPTVGRLFSIDVESSSGGDVLPVLIPPEFNQVNVQKGQKFNFQIEVGDKGLLKAKGIKKA